MKLDLRWFIDKCNDSYGIDNQQKYTAFIKARHNASFFVMGSLKRILREEGPSENA